MLMKFVQKMYQRLNLVVGNIRLKVIFINV